LKASLKTLTALVKSSNFNRNCHAL
jgi:hypothetical protein